MKRTFQKDKPQVHPSAYIHPSAEIIGRVTVARQASIWPLVVLRGDIERVSIGPRSNVQDSSIMHTSRGLPVVLGTGVTVGHGAIVHGARVGDYSLIGMGAILLDGCRIGRECLVGAGAVVPEGARIPPRSLVLGIPAKVKRPLSAQEIRMMHQRAADYIAYARQHQRHSKPL